MSVKSIGTYMLFLPTVLNRDFSPAAGHRKCFRHVECIPTTPIKSTIMFHVLIILLLLQDQDENQYCQLVLISDWKT